MHLKDRLLKRELTIGSWITIGNTSVAEIMANAGYDWLTVDMEHSGITINVAQELIRVIELSGVTPLVRVSANDPTLIKRVMDAGAHGVIVPMVNTPEEAERAVKSVKYPPEGFRGVGLARAQKYGLGFENYLEWNSSKSIVIVQIEHINAVKNLREILTVDGVDGYIVGPYDLSGSLGVPGQFDHPEVKNALKQISTVAKELNALSGFHVVPIDYEPFEEKVDEGYKFIAHGLDSLFLAKGCETIMKKITPLKQKTT